MSCQIIDGKAVAQKIREEIKKKTGELKKRGITPGLAVVLVGDDPASHIYVGLKEKACREVGFYSEIIKLPAGAAEEEVLKLVEELNKRPEIHGILVQLPLPKQVREEIIIPSVDPGKDVDGSHPFNMGRLFMGRPRVIPCTPYGCMKLIESAGYDLSGKHAVVVGRSNIVGKPMAALLLSRNATVTICHSHTRNLGTITREADVLVAAAGKANFIRGEMIKPGALVLDVGINRFPGGKVVGDVDFSSASRVAGMLTPVPGGVGPMTVAMLLMNTLKAVENNCEDVC
ncbi:MAG: bifunctional methylenetetrahydrofolate dehydrogenase/methenyltetrahydrofolate cyclohydrolase FolD [Peptococcaceae bacterium]|jgi:methylenetetrahydrofolate dehydrogenase (NADP+)/methenyltetrahydrofolate cyclohydrolase|nr:bifunctional methylenetetrahydrofolate dehydrogenase/methenyltetrahydrofolate cyclohydrolase FolD [Peptococcaceae bacterium]MDH7525340.1 bifunctional methylenetetrahydrofolate dehydrogenase/methenyltetrahydrofolate cyclohydrolase FolD [Peptococcaceae bacterium]